MMIVSRTKKFLSKKLFSFFFLDMIYSQKYPLFWTGNNHTNENSNALFQNISIETNTPEFLFVQRLFNKTVSETEIKIAFVSINHNLYYQMNLDADASFFV